MAIRDTMKLLNDDDSPEPSPTQSQLRNNQRSCPPGECSDQLFSGISTCQFDIK